MFRPVLSLLGAVLALSGCSLIPAYQRPAAPVPARYPGAADSGQESDAADIAWRNFIGDEQLQGLIELALANNRDLRVAILNVEQSRAQYRITRSASLPGLDGSASNSRSGGSGFSSSQWSASLATTAYQVDFFGRLHSLNQQALEQYLATEEARRDAQITLVAQVATEYFTLRELQEQLQLAQQTLTAVQGSYDYNRATFDAGAANALDLRTSEAQVESSKINLIDLQRQIVLAQDDLVLLVGAPLPVAAPKPRPLTDPGLLADIPAGLPSELVRRRPDILEAEHTLKASNANIGAARAAFFPSISLTGSVGSESGEFSRLLGSGTGVWSFTPQVTVPIFDGGQNRATLESAQVGLRIEVATYEKAIQTAFREVADALVATSSYTAEIAGEDTLVQTQQARYDLANARYRQGEDTYLNVLSAQQDLYSAQQGQIEARFNKLASQISLYQALGGGWK